MGLFVYLFSLCRGTLYTGLVLLVSGASLSSNQFWCLGGSRKKGSSGKRFELTKYLLKLFFLVEIIKPNVLNVKGLASED